jgi:hypothetical protein
VSLLSAENDIALVKSAEDMDDNDFELHINMRHSGELGGLGDISLSHMSAYVVYCWRIFHRTIHRLRQSGMNHEHAPYRGGNGEQPTDRAKAG